MHHCVCVHLSNKNPALRVEVSTGFYRSIMTLATILVYVSIPFVLVTLYFGTRNGFYDTDKYDGDGTAHKVLK